MPKRAATDARPGTEKASRRASGQAREKSPKDEIGEFEDAWEDEIDDDDAAQSDGMYVIFCSRPVHYACGVASRLRGLYMLISHRDGYCM
jgi:hypothetical protein